MRTKDKQTIARSVEDILQKADAEEHLQMLEKEEEAFEAIRDLNASIKSAEKKGNVEVKEMIEKE